MTFSLKVNIFFTRKHEPRKICILSQLFVLPGRPRRGAAVLSNPAQKKAMCCGKGFLSWLTVLFRSSSFFSTENTLTLQPAEKITFSCRAASRWWLCFGLQNYRARSWWRHVTCIALYGYLVGPTAFTQTLAREGRKERMTLHSAEDWKKHIENRSYDVAFPRACWTRVRCA